MGARSLDTETGPARTAYVLGAPISLADLLALPPDGNVYDRDEKGRLILTAPGDATRHRSPWARLVRQLARAVDESTHELVPEAPVAFPKTAG